ncbi:FxsA family protein [Pseudoalteromonas fenneropenaei]|uniref:FxsA family protein n=1 Tax=Pseudoalteromonas fenneropenaei TaxID=1737459 RepID=A0ABV7CLM6_9GAMM
MFRLLFLLFIAVPIVEIALLIQVSEVIGGWATIALVIATAVLGAKLVKQQGTQALRSVQGEMARGQMPAKELFDGLCVVIAGVLLMTPGIMTDALGFLLLTPLVRAKLAAGLMRQATVHVARGAAYSHTSHYSTERSQPQQNSTIEGEFERKD